MSEIQLNEQQEKAKDLIIDWFKNKTHEKLIFVLAGYAGTGKTFLINHIITNELKLDGKVAFIAPTGKAASVLIQRGAINACTIHKLIYNRVEKESETELNGKIIKTKRFEFIKKPSIPNYKLIILDEVSMVDEKTIKDLISFGIPILCCGDSAQLPSINKSANLLDKPDFNLTQIVRQAEDDMIVKIATMARNGIDIPTGNYGNVIVINKNYLTEENYKNILTKADQVLCGTNRMRKEINHKIKGYLGLDQNKINIGEKIICLLNNWEVYLDEDEEYSLVNGIIGYVKENKTESETLGLGKMTFQADFLEDECRGLIYDEEVFKTDEFKYQFHQQVYLMDDGSYQVKEIFVGRQSGESKKDYQKRIRDYAIQKRDAVLAEQINFFEPAYCISVHKSQGSEFDNIVVFDESNIFGNDSNKWLYTAITRAKKKLIIIK